MLVSGLRAGRSSGGGRVVGGGLAAAGERTCWVVRVLWVCLLLLLLGSSSRLDGWCWGVFCREGFEVERRRGVAHGGCCSGIRQDGATRVLARRDGLVGGEVCCNVRRMRIWVVDIIAFELAKYSGTLVIVVIGLGVRW